MKQTEISSFDELRKEFQAKSKEVTIPKRDCHTGKKIIGFRNDCIQRRCSIIA